MATTAADTQLSATVVTHQTRLAAALTSPSATTNAVFSPLSLHVAISLLTAGAGGATRDQLAVILGGGGVSEDLHGVAEQMAQLVLADESGVGGPRVAFANGVFVDSSLKLKPAFEEVAARKYKEETRSFDFQKQPAEAADQVNSWVKTITSGLIKELLPPGSANESTRLVLGNALYFKGSWAQKFDASKTKDRDFHLLDGSSVQVPFVSSTEDQFIASYKDFQVLMLPYLQAGYKREFSMYILLPEARDGLWSLAEKLSSEPGFLEKHMPHSDVPVTQFKVPKFKISFGFEASDLIKRLASSSIQHRS